MSKKTSTPLVMRAPLKVGGSYEDPFVYVDIPNEVGESVYRALKADMVECERSPGTTHITVLNTDEILSLRDKNDWGRYWHRELGEGREFTFTLGKIVELKPAGWPEVSKVWFVECKSPELEAFRASFGLTPKVNGNHEFHITAAIRKVQEKSASQYEGLCGLGGQLGVDFSNVTKIAADDPVGTNDEWGNILDVPTGRPIPWVVQEHKQRRGMHHDMRFGPAKTGLFSWAVPKGLPGPGEKRLAVRTPIHPNWWANFEGRITSKKGRGIVKTHDKGSVILSKVEPDKINFTVIHRGTPEDFTMIRKGGKDGVRKQEDWLLINTTPLQGVKYPKLRMKRVPAEDVEKMFNPEYTVQSKLDGASAVYHILANKIRVLSYRTSKDGKPIVHTHKVLGPGGMASGIEIPKKFHDTILRGELFGVRRGTGKAIPAAELGGILNASVENALKKKEDQDVELRNAIFNVEQVGGKPVSVDQPYEERLAIIKELLPYLPSAGKFGLPPMADSPEGARQLWGQIVGGKDPLTREGIVAWPNEGGPPVKVKTYPESDVVLRGVFPGKGKYEGLGAGGFEYSLPDSDEVVGKVGTGFDDETRKWLWEHKDDPEVLGRVARIRAQEQFPSGAYRAPSFIALHEDYPAVKSAANSPEHEAKCRQCGECCRHKLKIKGKVWFLKSYCEYLDPDTKLCTIYEDRHEKNPRCLSVDEAKKTSVLPADCPYVKDDPDYVCPEGYMDDETAIEILTGQVTDEDEIDKRLQSRKDNSKKASVAPLYHGSRRRLDVLQPRGEHGDINQPGAAVFATPLEQMALAYLGRKWGNRDLGQGGWGSAADDPVVELTEMRPGALEDTYGGMAGYLYELPRDTFKMLQRNDAGEGYDWELVSEQDVTPTRRRRIRDVLAALKEHPRIRLNAYDPKSKAFKSELRHSVRWMKSMKPEDVPAHYKWFVEKAPPEVVEALNAEMKRQGIPVPKLSKKVLANKGAIDE